MSNNNRRNHRGHSAVYALTIILMALLVVGLAAFMLPGGFGFNGTRNEKQIAQDVQALDSTISKYGLSVDKVNITKRQTRTEDHVDRVWADLTASNKYYTYTGSWTLTYDQYNEGWELGAWKEEAHTLVTREAITEARVIADLKAEGFTDIIISEFNVHGTVCEAKCSGLIDNKIKSGGLRYDYDPERGWHQLFMSMW